MFAQNMYQSTWKRLLLLTGLVLVLGSGCSGDQKDSAADKHTAGGSERASKADLDAAAKKSFKESDAPGVVAAVQTPSTRG
jgi:hypothetical protein